MSAVEATDETTSAKEDTHQRSSQNSDCGGIIYADEKVYAVVENLIVLNNNTFNNTANILSSVTCNNK